jgi:DNA mismatch repair protein MutS
MARKKINKMSIALASFVAVQVICVAALTRKEVASNYIASLSLAKQNNNIEPNKFFPSLSEQELNKRDLKDAPYSHLDLISLAFKMLDQKKDSATIDPNSAETGKQQLFENLLKDLAILQGQSDSPDKNLVGQLNCCTTIFGEVALALLLAQQPLSGNSRDQRQALIKKFVENEELFAKAKKILTDVRESIEQAAFYWKEKNHQTATNINNLYTKWLPQSQRTSPTALNAARVTGHVIKDIALPLVFHIIIGFAPSEGAYFRALKLENNMNTAEIEMIDRVLLFFAIYGVPAGVWWLRSSSIAENNYNTCYIQEKLQAVARVLKAAKEMKQLLLEKEEILPHEILNILDPRGNASKESAFAQLVNLLQTAPFEGSSSFFSNMGTILAANCLMEQHKENLAPLYSLLGEIDVCLSMAQLIKEHSGGSANFCFADKNDSKEPSINTQGFWNPFVKAKHAVLNDIELGGGKQRIAAVTGHNTGGKSTLMKALMINLVLDKVFGIAAASSFMATEFDTLGSSMNISDNTVDGDSRFKNEVKRAKTLLEVSNELKKEGKRGFYIIDELFTGTVSEVGEDAVCKLLERLVENKNLLLIIATHYNKVTELAKKYKDEIANYKVEVKQGTSSEGIAILTRPFKLEPGVVTHNNKIANIILEQEIKAVFDNKIKKDVISCQR